jgi:hypothetical protein
MNAKNMIVKNAAAEPVSYIGFCEDYGAPAEYIKKVNQLEMTEEDLVIIDRYIACDDNIDQDTLKKTLMKQATISHPKYLKILTQHRSNVGKAIVAIYSEYRNAGFSDKDASTYAYQDVKNKL